MPQSVEASAPPLPEALPPLEAGAAAARSAGGPGARLRRSVTAVGAAIGHHGQPEAVSPPRVFR
jgi:hypothetical protein